MFLPIDIHFISVVSNGIRFSDQGIDIGMPCGTPVVAVADGVVVFAGPSQASASTTDSPSGESDGPLMVLIKLAEVVAFEGQDYSWARYENLICLDLRVETGEDQLVEVRAGQRLGRSGAARGVPHLNFSLLADKNGSPGRALPRDDLQRFLWREVAQAQLGFSAVT